MKSRPTRRPIRRRTRHVVLRTKVKHERRKTVLKMSGVVMVCAALVWGGTRTWKSVDRFLFKSDRFAIREISIRGARNISESEITALLPFRSGDNLFRVWLADAEKNLAQCKPELKKVRMSRGWQKVTVAFEERVPVAAVVVNGQRMGLDYDNKPFPLRGNYFRMQLPEVGCLQENDRRTALNFVRLLSSRAGDVLGRIKHLSVEPVEDIVFDLKDGVHVYWGAGDERMLAPKLERLQQVLGDAKERFSGVEYVNLLYFDKGRILVKPKKASARVPEQPAPLAKL